MDTTQLSMEELGGSSKHSPSPDLSFASPAPPTASRRTTLALVTLIASSTFSSFTVQRSRLHSLRVLLALPIAQWSLSLAYLWSTLRRERTTGRGGGRREWAIGALLAISGTLRIWEARMLPFAVWSGFEVLLIGLLTVTRNSEADSSSARRIAIASILVAVVGSIFVGGGPQSARGVAVSIAQVGATGFVWISIENIGELSSGSSATTIAALLKISSNVGTIFIPARNLLVLALGSYFGLGGGVAHALEPFLATTYLLAFTVTTIIILRSLTLHSQPHLSPPSKIRFILPRLALLPFILFTLISLFPSPDLPLPLLSHYKNSNLTIDLVIAHYDTPLPSTSAHISHLLHSPFLSLRTPRIFFYEKGSTSNPDLWDHFPLNRERGDEVAPDDDPIHQSWGPNNSGGQSNPAFGHSVERSWPLIFDCDDPALVRRCDDLSWKVEDCQCSD
ncbi:hypothetical protein RQP46_004005 [Phenoliferia psychrophenolica]